MAIRFALRAGMAFSCVLTLVNLLAGCMSIPIDSNPKGARVIMDGRDTGKTTPAKLFIGSEIPEGKHTVTVVTKGYTTVTPPWELDMEFHPAEGVMMAILAPPLGIDFGFDQHWKSASPESAAKKPIVFELAIANNTARLPPDVAPTMNRQNANTSLSEPAPSSAISDNYRKIDEKLQKLGQMRKSGLITNDECTKLIDSL